MRESEIFVGSVTEFLRVLDLYYQNRIEDYHSAQVASITYFRGHSNAEYELSPSLYRMFRGPGGLHLTLYKNEQALIHDSLQLNPSEFDLSNPFEILCKLQHFGLPTRLLDVSSNPLVALYFATGGSPDTLGEVILVPPFPTFPSDARSVRILSEFALRGSWEHFAPDRFADDLSKKTGHHRYSDSEVLRTLTIPWTLVKPLYTNPRLRAQQGAFMLFGGELVTEADPTTGRLSFRPTTVDRHVILKAQQKFFQTEEITMGRMLITGTAKLSIRKQLDRLGINRATLFPEIEHQLGYVIDSYRSGYRGSELGWERQFQPNNE